MPVMATEPTKRSRSGLNLNLYVDEELRLALDDYIDEYNATADHKATLRSSVEAALKAFLKASGHWPRKRRDGGGDGKARR